MSVGEASATSQTKEGLAYLKSINEGKTPLKLGDDSIICPIVKFGIDPVMGKHKVVVHGANNKSACIFMGNQHTAKLILAQVDRANEALARMDEAMLAAAKAEICRLIEYADVAPPAPDSDTSYTGMLDQYNIRLQRGMKSGNTSEVMNVMAEMNAFVRANSVEKK